MKNLKTLSIVLLLAVTALSQAQTALKVSTKDNQVQLVSLRSRGQDVRTVLHDLFDQAKRSYVLDNISRTELYLSLDDLEFEEALELIVQIAELRYEKQNGIYFISKNRRPARDPQTPRDVAAQSASVSPSISPIGVKPTPKPQARTEPTKPAATSGKLPDNVLNRKVKGTYRKRALRDILKDLQQQTGVTIELDEKVPVYYLDLQLNTTSLGWVIRKLGQELGLKFEFTNRQSIRISKK